MTLDDIRALDAWVRQVTATHPGLPIPWRVTMSPHDPTAPLIVQVDPVEAERRGHGSRADEVCRIPVTRSAHAAREAIKAILDNIAGDGSKGV